MIPAIKIRREGNKLIVDLPEIECSGCGKVAPVEVRAIRNDAPPSFNAGPDEWYGDGWSYPEGWLLDFKPNPIGTRVVACPDCRPALEKIFAHLPVILRDAVSQGKERALVRAVANASDEMSKLHECMLKVLAASREVVECWPELTTAPILGLKEMLERLDAVVTDSDTDTGRTSAETALPNNLPRGEERGREFYEEIGRKGGRKVRDLIEAGKKEKK